MLRALLFGVLVSTAAASPLEREARSAFVRARAECRRPGPRLRALVSELFHASRFASRVVDGFAARNDAERATFLALADRIVGGDTRAAAIRDLCVAGAIEDAHAHDDATVYIKLRTRDGEPCTSLIFERAAVGWRYRGEWFCGVTIPLERWWREQHGNGDFGAAIDDLRKELARR